MIKTILTELVNELLIVILALATNLDCVIWCASCLLSLLTYIYSAIGGNVVPPANGSGNQACANNLYNLFYGLLVPISMVLTNVIDLIVDSVALVVTLFGALGGGNFTFATHCLSHLLTGACAARSSRPYRTLLMTWSTSSMPLSRPSSTWCSASRAPVGSPSLRVDGPRVVSTRSGAIQGSRRGPLGRNAPPRKRPRLSLASSGLISFTRATGPPRVATSGPLAVGVPHK